MRRHLLGPVGVVLLLGLAAPTAAQTPTVINPTMLEFDSLDHAVACPGDRCVVSYTVEAWGASVDPVSGAPIVTCNLPKTAVAPSPPPTVSPAYRAPFASCAPMLGLPTGQLLVIRLRAVGDFAASERSTPSPPFVRAVAARSPTNVRVSAP